MRDGASREPPRAWDRNVRDRWRGARTFAEKEAGRATLTGLPRAQKRDCFPANPR